MKQIATREHQLGNLGHAKTLYEQHLSENSNDDDAWHALGVLHAQRNDLTAAQEALQKAISLNKSNAIYHNSLGNVLRQHKDFDNAISAYKKAIKLNSNYASAFNNLGATYFQLDRLSSAEKAYQKAIELKPTYADAYCNLGILYTKMNAENAAKIALEKALSLNPDLITAENQLGDYYLRHGQYDAAYLLFQSAAKKAPQQAEIQHRLGISAFHKKDYHQAKKQFEITLRLQSSHPEAHQYLANTLLALKQHDDALTHYFNQLEKSAFYETYYNIAVLLMLKERLKESLTYFDEAEKLNPHDAAIFINRGHIHLKRNETNLAITAYKKALLLKPNDTEILHILSAIQQNKTPEKAPKDFVTNLFDQYAPYYDTHLQTRLAYDVPQKIVETLQLADPTFFNTKKNMVDLGCGTGLCGTLLKPYANTLIGIDISPNMLHLAKEKMCYTQLLEGDIADHLKILHGIDFIIAADVFTYIGDLSEIFQYASNALNPKGLFAFTVEKSFKESYALLPSVRYAHHKDYLCHLAAQYHFTVLRLDNIALRKQKADWIEGYFVLLAKDTGCHSRAP